mmetsp:Transcript_12097/g.26488  ORF Transcript_12097/g.26488 Transcript_12097/m.26488 type:complete len:280 (-) Transcript_12097:92-931(-)
MFQDLFFDQGPYLPEFVGLALHFIFPIFFPFLGHLWKVTFFFCFRTGDMVQYIFGNFGNDGIGGKDGGDILFRIGGGRFWAYQGTFGRQGRRPRGRWYFFGFILGNFCRMGIAIHLRQHGISTGTKVGAAMFDRGAVRFRDAPAGTSHVHRHETVEIDVFAMAFFQIGKLVFVSRRALHGNAAQIGYFGGGAVGSVGFSADLTSEAFPGVFDDAAPHRMFSVLLVADHEVVRRASAAVLFFFVAVLFFFFFFFSSLYYCTRIATLEYLNQLSCFRFYAQ